MDGGFRIEDRGLRIPRIVLLYYSFTRHCFIFIRYARLKLYPVLSLISLIIVIMGNSSSAAENGYPGIEASQVAGDSNVPPISRSRIMHRERGRSASTVLGNPRASFRFTSAEVNKSIPLVVLRDVDSQTEPLAREYSVQGRQLLVMPRWNAPRTIIFCSVAYLFLCAVFTFSTLCQSLLVYLHVVHWPLGDLTDLHKLGLSHARNINVTTADGLTLQGYHFLPPSVAALPYQDDVFQGHLQEAERVVLYFHGNGASRAVRFRLETAKALASHLNAHVIAVDYRGFGGSQGWPSEEGTRMDAQAVMDWVKNGGHSRHKRSPSARNDRKKQFVYLYAQSLGTAIATQLAVDENEDGEGVDGVILDAPFSTLKEAVMTHPLGSIFRVFPIVREVM